MSEEEKDPVEIVKITEDEDELDPEEIKELEGIIEDLTEESDEEQPTEEHTSDDEEENEEPAEDTVPEITEQKHQQESLGEKTEPIPDSSAEISADSPSDDLEEDTESTETPPEHIGEPAPIITNHVVPTEECWLLKRNKTGFTLPKEVRDMIHPQQNFALVLEGHELAFYMVNEDDIPKLKLARKKIEPKPKGQRDKRAKKKREGPEPDFPRYFHFEVEEQNKVQDALESAFYKFAETPPAIGEGMNLVIYVLTTYIKGQKMNDSRLRQTVIFFLCHIIEQFNQPQLIDFIQREILDEIQSPYLYQICLNQLAYTSFLMNKHDKMNEFISLCIEVINKYDIAEMFAIMDSFKHITHTLTPIIGKRAGKEELTVIKNALDTYSDKLEEISYQIQYLEMLERMNFVEDAYDKAKMFMDKLDAESPLKDQFKEIRRRIGSKPVE